MVSELKRMTTITCLILAALLCAAAVTLAHTAPAQAATRTLVVAARNSTSTANADYVCDGTSDQVQIQAAINALGGSAGTVHLLDGTFYISGTIQAYQNLTLEGSGYATLLYLSNNSNCAVISNAGGYNIPRANVTIRSLRINGNKSNQSSGHGIIRTGGYASYDTLWVENCDGRGISHHYGDSTRVVNSTVRDCTCRGIFLEEDSRAEITGNKVYNCGLSSNGVDDKAIDIYGGADNKILNNYIDGGGAMSQIGAWISPRVEIAGNALANGAWMGIGPYSQYTRINDNTITNAGNNAIDTCGADDNWIEGNTISHVDRIPLGGAGQENTGICVNSNRSTVINNTVEFAGRAGIHIGPSDNDNKILNNVIRNCGQQVSYSAGIWLQIWKSSQPMVIKGTIIRGNAIYDSQSKKTQKYGVILTTSGLGYIDNVIIEDNDLRGNAVSGIAPYDSARVRNPHIENNAADLPSTGSTDSTAPPVPTLLSPSDGGATGDITPTLNWSDVTDASAVHYQLQVDNNADFSSPVVAKTSIASSQYTLTSGLSNQVYYWRVRAVDGAGNIGAWTSRFAFTVDSVAPAVPSLVSPARGAHTATTKPTLDWSTVTDATSVHYELQVDNNGDFSSPVIGKTWISASTYTLTSSLPDGSYYWRVRAVDKPGNKSAWTGSRYFVAP